MRNIQKNKPISFAIAMLLILTLFVPYVPDVYAAEVNAEVAGVKGTVTVKRAASEKTFNAFAGLKLKLGDVVTTGKSGEIVINIGTDKTIKALSDSSFKISSLSGTDTDSKAGFTLIKGTVFNEVRAKQKSSEGLSVQTGNTVVGVRGTTYSVSLRGKDGFTVHTLEGSVFLDSVIKRLEDDNNASLIHQQMEVGAGEGANASGVYDFSVTDLLRDELQYIIDNPNEFGEGLVQEAEGQLKNLPDPTTPPVDTVTEIVYQPDPAPGGGGSSSGSTPAPAATYTVTLNNEYGAHDTYGSPVNYEYHYGTNINVTVASGASLSSSPLANQIEPVRLGSNFAGWSTTTNGAVEYTTTTAITGNAILYPIFTPAPTMGTGTLNDPYILTENNFPHFRYYAHTSDGLGAKYELGEDINCSIYQSGGNRAGFWAWDWEPIGDYPDPYTRSFTGIFDGNSKTISNFSLNTTTRGYAGFFGYISATGSNEGVVKDLTIKGTATTSSNAGPTLYIGGITGYAQGATITNCHADIDVYSENTSTGGGGGACAGGIIGWAAGNTNSITNCSSSGNVTARSNNPGGGYVYAGGIVGNCESNITGCSAGGTINAINNASSNNVPTYAGGIVGLADAGATIERCSANATISARSPKPILAGGISGINGTSGGSINTITNCYFVGSVTANSSSSSADADALAGGITGQNFGTISNCYYNGGTIEATGTSNDFVGGITGHNYFGSITACAVYEGGTVSSTNNADHGRICGFSAVNTALTGNYANTAFTLNGQTATDNQDNYNGEDAAIGSGAYNLATQAFWQTTLGWSIGSGQSDIWLWSGSGPPTLNP